MNSSLAIVIPAYKALFLDKTLESLSNQSNKNFTLYVGDDASPNDIKKIVDDFSDRLNIVYHRFDNNIGAKDLVHQWNRCVQLTQGEEWVWLFADDDVMDSNCVEVFYKTIEDDNKAFDVYRFNTRVIDDNDTLLTEAAESPFIDNSENMAMEILFGRRGNSMPDHIFLTKAVKNNNGFIYTEYAQCADWASSIFFSYPKGIKTMAGAKVNWRVGQSNLSGLASKKRIEMFVGHIRFLKWVYTFFHSKSDFQNSALLGKAILANLNWVIKQHYKGLNAINYWRVFSLFNYIGLSKIDSIKQFYYLERNLIG